MMSERNHVGLFKTAMNSRDGTQHCSKKQWARFDSKILNILIANLRG